MLDEFKEFINLDDEYTVRILSKEDENVVQGLCERCLDFFILTEDRYPEKGAGHEILFDLPPDKELKDKFVFGVYKEGTRLVAVVDLLKDYKQAGEWVIGLLMIDPVERGKGLGVRIHEFIRDTVVRHQAHTLRIGVVEDNKKAFNFWSKLGYSEKSRVNARYGNKNNVVIVMNQSLGQI